MALKVELKPGERIIVGTAVLRNGDSRTRFYIDGDAPILRERDLSFVLDRGGAQVFICAAEYRGFDHGELGVRLIQAIPSLMHVVTVRGARDGALPWDELATADDDAAPAVGRRRWRTSRPSAAPRPTRKVRCTRTTP